MTKPLETPKELATRLGISVARIRYLIREDMLDHIYMAPGRRNAKIPAGAWENLPRAFHCARDGAAPRAEGRATPGRAAMRAVPPLLASDTTAARLLDLRTPQFLKLVQEGHLPPGREIAPGVLRWDTEVLRRVSTGEADARWDHIQW